MTRAKHAKDAKNQVVISTEGRNLLDPSPWLGTG